MHYVRVGKQHKLLIVSFATVCNTGLQLEHQQLSSMRYEGSKSVNGLLK